MAGPCQHLLALLLCATAAFAGPTGVVHKKQFNFGTIGDSWASGVTYGVFDYTNYDDNKSGCMRINHAYGVQLMDDWPATSAPPRFTFAACSGARLVDMWYGQQQMKQLPDDTHFVTMQAGGNDASFYDVASNCIFHNEDQDYGGEYPNPGACLDAINRSQNFIQAGHLVDGTWKDTDDTIKDILRHDSAKQSDFKLYVLGYAHCFNVDSPDSDWCNDESFSVSTNEWRSGNKVKLSNALRSKINDLTTSLNAQIQDVVDNMNDKRVVYISITEGFNGHRFCERGSSWWHQYLDPDVWLWNASPAGLFGPSVATIDQTNATETWANAYNATFTYEPNLEAFNWVDLLAMEKGPNAQSPHQGWSPGSALRPFHPTKDGHGAIKDILKKQIAKDFM